MAARDATPFHCPQQDSVISSCALMKTNGQRSKCSRPYGLFQVARRILAPACGGLLLLAIGPVPAADAQVDEVKDFSGQEEPYDDPTRLLGSWIWDHETLDSQPCFFWQTFEIPAERQVMSSKLRMTVDNEFTLFLDGREIGHGAEWRELFEFDLTPLLKPGRHVLAVQALNSFSLAGMLLGMRVELDNGEVISIQSDESWRVVPRDIREWKTRTAAPDDWPHVHVQSSFGEDPYWTSPLNINVMPRLTPVETHFWQSGWFQTTVLLTSLMILFVSLRLAAKLALHQKDQKLLYQERARIAQDIHDDIGARMSQLVLHGEVAQSELPDHSPARENLDVICEDARGIMSSMDEILWAVNPQRDTLRDFTSFVCRYAEDFVKPTSMQCRFDVDSELDDIALVLHLRRPLLMAIKEALNNAVKHSGATELRLQISLCDQKLVVSVVDNGRGFDPLSRRPDRLGLANLEDRMKQLDGRCTVSSKPGHGCKVEFAVPLTRSHRRRS